MPSPAMMLLVAGWAAATRTVEARAPEPQSCSERGPAGDWLKQAQDANRTYEERKTAYEQVLGLCPRARALYAGLSALLLEHQDIPERAKLGAPRAANCPGRPRTVTRSGRWAACGQPTGGSVAGPRRAGADRPEPVLPGHDVSRPARLPSRTAGLLQSPGDGLLPTLTSSTC